MKGGGQALIHIQNNFINRPDQLTASPDFTAVDKNGAKISDHSPQEEKTAFWREDAAAMQNGGEIVGEDQLLAQHVNAYNLEAEIAAANKSLIISTCIR